MGFKRICFKSIELENPKLCLSYDNAWTILNLILKYFFFIFLKFKKRTFEKFDIRIYDKKLIFPIYDGKKVLVDTILVTSSDMEKSSEAKMNTFLNKNYIYGQNALHVKSNEIIITDEIINSLAIWDSLDKPSLVINSVDCMTPKVNLLKNF